MEMVALFLRRLKKNPVQMIQSRYQTLPSLIDESTLGIGRYCLCIVVVEYSTMVPSRVILNYFFCAWRLAYTPCAPHVRLMCARLGADGYLRFSLVS